MAFSQDPIRRVKKLVQLLQKVVADVEKVKTELDVKKQKFGEGGTPSGSANVFDNEKKIIADCNTIIKKLEGSVC